MTERRAGPVDLEPVRLHFPFHGRWTARNSPARRVPSHGTHVLGTTYAIDFVAVDGRGRSASWGWRAAFGTERPESFVGFGQPILAPVSGTVVVAHDGEPDHPARRSLTAGLPYLLTQARRLREGAAAIAGNHVVIAVPDGPYVLLAHLQRGTVSVSPGRHVAPGELIGACGNSGNSTQPHVHIQATDLLPTASAARGLPIAFVAAGGDLVLPDEGQVVTV